MTTQTTPAEPTGSSRPCHVCGGHDLDQHILVLVRKDPIPMGLAYCPEPGCTCGWTWRANTRPSTPQQIAETRRLVRQALLDHGCAIPPWLRD